ncbi:MAG: tRNA pseudouridine(38-40) synthase TruA [Salinibacterium sp.]|nr:tRNA pseudouridine(38-40) synthase TruA [Salinibacterium sp.]
MTDEPLTRLRLDISYDGTDFAGWARQPGLRTVQGELEAAIATVLRVNPPTLTVAGRTDAGVHATGQVAHLDLTDAQLTHLAKPHGRGAKPMDPARAIVKRLNGIAGLRSDIHVRSAIVAPRGFDARFSPVYRRYQYRIADATAERNPLLRRHTLWYPAELDLDAMTRAANELLGLHDWAAYCRPREGATTIRELQEFGWRRDDTGVLIASLTADAFCHSMVRALVGASVSVGAGRLSGERLLGIRAEATRTSEFKVMPAQGLTLVEVGYPADAELAVRAAQTRARRDRGDGLG